MELPDPITVRYALTKTIEDLDFFIEFISTKEQVSFTEYHARLHTIDLELIELWHRINLLTVTDGKYSKAFEKLRKIMIKILIDSNEIERKHVKYSPIRWESAFQGGRLRKDLIDHLRIVSKQLKNTEKII